MDDETSKIIGEIIAESDAGGRGAKGARIRLRKFFEANVGKVVTKEQLSKVAKIYEWARRIRELRDDEGMQIQSHHDNPGLKPGEYRLLSLKRTPRVSHKIDAKLRVRILERNGFTCQQCGATGADPDPLDPRRHLRLHIDHIDPNGPSEETNLRVLCSACNEGRSNLSVPRSTINLLAAIRRSSRDDQLKAYEWLQTKFSGNE